MPEISRLLAMADASISEEAACSRTSLEAAVAAAKAAIDTMWQLCADRGLAQGWEESREELEREVAGLDAMHLSPGPPQGTVPQPDEAMWTPSAPLPPELAMD
jgi:hypothetical protein